MPVKGGDCGCDKKGGAKKLTPYNKFMSSEMKRLKKLAQYKNTSHNEIFKIAAKNWSNNKK
jgi:hypothetical protein